jgi:hypothetical protein
MTVLETLKRELICVWLGLAVCSRTDLRIVRISQHVKQVQNVEPQEDHLFLASFFSVTVQLRINLI